MSDWDDVSDGAVVAGLIVLASMLFGVVMVVLGALVITGVIG